ncbi:glycoside hydrolase family 12 protein [Mucidula mucida]|nr:glycoside hydrolase family 12 protein [Mucidula mucida]
MLSGALAINSINFAIVLASVIVSLYAAPLSGNSSTVLERRGAVLSGQFDTESEINGRFILENNLWGMGSATSGSQNSQVTATNGNSVSWYTSYTWQGAPSQVKSYSNLDLRTGLGKRISAITSIPAMWSWTYSTASSDLVADVSYDLWLSNTAGTGGASTSSTFEIMIWLSTRGGAGPAGSQINTISINGVSWHLFKDLKPFLTYLTSNQGVSSSQFLVQAQGGTEPFIGTARLTSNSYALAIN